MRRVRAGNRISSLSDGLVTSGECAADVRIPEHIMGVEKVFGFFWDGHSLSTNATRCERGKGYTTSCVITPNCRDGRGMRSSRIDGSAI